MRRANKALCLLLAVTLSGCGTRATIPFYRQTNHPVEGDDAALIVRREGTPRHKARAGQGRGRVWLSKPFDRFLRFVGPFLPSDVAERNRRRVENVSTGLYDPQALANLTEDPFPDVDVVLCLSGGGLRAANLSAGVMLELSRIPVKTPDGRQVSLLDTVDTVSSVSGGSFAAAFWLYHRAVFAGNLDQRNARTHRGLIEAAMARNLGGTLIWNLLLVNKISTLVRFTTYASRTDLYSNMIEYNLIRPQRVEKLESTLLRRGWRRNPVLYHVVEPVRAFLSLVAPVNLHDQYLLRGRGRTFDDLYLEDPVERGVRYPLRPQWLINATLYNAPVDNNAFLFDLASFERMRSDWLDYRVSDAVAASAAFPVFFAPVTLRDWSNRKPSYLFLLDGGVSDNLGLNGADSVIAASDRMRRKVIIVVDASTRAGWVVRSRPGRPSLFDVSDRALDRYMSEVRRQRIEEFRKRSATENLRFFHLSIRPEDGPPLPKDQADAVKAANSVSTGLSISPEEQDTLFKAARILVGREGGDLIRAVTGADGGPVPPKSAPAAAPARGAGEERPL